MLPTHRTQPYREGAATREAGAALQAMLQGRQARMLNPADFNRQRMQMAAQGGQQGGLRELMRRPSPRATADVRGNFTPRPHEVSPEHWRLADILLAMNAAGPTLVR